MSAPPNTCKAVLANISAYLDGELETTACDAIEALVNGLRESCKTRECAKENSAAPATPIGLHIWPRSNAAEQSTSPLPLFPYVERGLFDEALYYRLNVILAQIDSANSGPFPTRISQHC
jgi:hypothetical protein